MTTAPDRKGGENDRAVKEEEEEQVRSMGRLVSLCDQKELRASYYFNKAWVY
ncbi:hypothetical protein COCNU_02G008070 [Cocos nucifera]|uniref:Uncharacterized protein n=1 Tax=Cocos nucifera TaxID=13894 RepID=A0A8K0HZQ9_COCNU|nr:hypothetical protein COCNU_02G008070 [Cocos nucifera]